MFIAGNIMSSHLQENYESIESLVQRVNVLLDTVDAKTDVDPDLKSDIAVAELSGTKLSDRYRKLAILIHRHEVSNDEARRYVAVDSSPES